LLGLLIYITGLKIALFDRISWWIELEPLARWTQRQRTTKAQKREFTEERKRSHEVGFERQYL